MSQLLTSLVILASLASISVIAQAHDVDLPTLAKTGGYEGRIRLVRFLDEPDGYCIDVPGPPGNPLPLNMWAHTCHMFAEIDQVFSVNKEGDNKIVWNSSPSGKPKCLTAISADAGAEFVLDDCSNSKPQTFKYTKDAQFRLANTNLCIHVQTTGPAPRQEPAETQDSRGRGRSINPALSHLARALVLAACDTGDDGFSRWMAIN